ncbi:MAG: aldo/keto reductase [Anaerolineales bacterium]|nr:aldo/keto reductase [Anaerolineales bacterium]
MVKAVLQKRTLGGTSFQVSPIGLGVMQFSGGDGLSGMMFPNLPQEDKNAIVKAALNGGINWFDTAEMYGRGRSEEGLASGLQAAGVQDDEVIIGTKWFPIFRRASNIPRTIEARIHFLKPYTIDLYMVHQPWGFSSTEAEMDAMAELVGAGKIRSIGVSNFNVERMHRAHKALQKRGLSLAVNQVEYSLLQRRIESNGVLEAAKELGVTIVAWGPLAYGVLTGKYHKDPKRLDRKAFPLRMRFQGRVERARPLVQALEEVGERYEATPAQVALNWLINFHGETVVAIPGATKVHQIEQNAGAMKFKLSEVEMARLDELSREFR